MKKSFDDSSFSVAAPKLWNALPASLRNIYSILTFKSCLKIDHYFIIVKFSLCTYLVYSNIVMHFLIIAC